MDKEVLSKAFLTNADIAKLMCCSASKASKIRRIVRLELEQMGKRLVTNDIPTKLFVELMNLDVESINNALQSS